MQQPQQQWEHAQREQLQRERDREASFQHTQLGVYLAGAFGLMYLWASSAQGIVDKYHFSKRWFYLYGALCLFAYLYMRPFVRRGLGSAGRGYLNFGTLYICWLCSAVFCHLPSFEALGIDIKADVSLGLSIAASSFLVLGVMHGVQQLLIHFKLLTPAPGATQQAVWTCTLLNTLTLAMTCSTFYQLCGNGGIREGLQDSSFLHEAVCAHWLSPISTTEYPNFSAWMLYGEAAGSTAAAAAAAANSKSPAAARSSSSAASPPGSGASSSSIFNASFWWGASPAPSPPPPPAADPFGLMGPFNASQIAELVSPVAQGGADSSSGSVISPVFTMWITLVALYIVNVLADHVAAYNMSARHISELRRDFVPDPDIALLAQLSTAAGITLRENAHQWAAAQQQRHAEARRSLGGRGRPSGMEVGRSSRGSSKKHSGIKRSKSLESHRPAKQPWSPRYTMERALVNILETTSSFSFKAAALLEGKPFTWQDSLNPGASANLSTHMGAVRTGAAAAAGAAAAGGGAGAGACARTGAAAAAGRQARQQREGRGGRSGSSSRQRHDVSDSVGSLSPASAASTGDVAGGAGSSHASTAAAASRLGAASRGSAQQQQQQQAWMPAGDRQMQKEPSFKVGVLPAAGGGSNGSSGSSARLAVKAPRHQRSRSLSSIQSGDGGSLRDGDDEDTVSAELPQLQQQQQQQRQEELSVPSVPPVTSPFARVSHMQQHWGALERCGFGSTISLHAGTPPSSHRWSQQQHLLWQQAQVQAHAQAHAHAHVTDASSTTSSRGQGGPGSGGSPATTATPLSAVGGGFPGTVTAAAAAGGGSASAAGGAAAAGVSKVVAAAAAAAAAVQPPFLDMVPWYSGTSADLFKTMFDLLISVKLFLGRFDMRTMQAATAASMAEHPAHSMPQEGDGFTFEQYADRGELWLDFIADTGDGGNPTYAVARALAAPELLVPVSNSSSSSTVSAGAPPAATGGGSSAGRGGGRVSTGSSSILEGARKSGVCQAGRLELPRGEVLLIGGDLAYPNPSRETFEQRLFVPFQEAMPPPPHYHPGRLVVHKPDLPPSFGPPAPPTRLGGVGPLPVGLSPRASRGASVAALREYGGPNAFAIPGNHDWIDGLETFIQQIQHKGWLGGWLLPQEKSYFALRLPAGWWVFGLDLALVGDIDMCQYRYFANLIEQRLGPDDNVIIITHEPTWLLEWFWASSSSSNLRQLVRGHLRGRARVHLAGDLHFYMRHSYCGSSSGAGGWAGSSSAEAGQQHNEASAAAAMAAAAAAAATGNHHNQQHQQQRQVNGTAAVAAAVGGVGGGRRLSSGSDGGSSSSSGVDSCTYEPEAAAAFADGLHSHLNYLNQQQQRQQSSEGASAHAAAGSTLQQHGPLSGVTDDRASDSSAGSSSMGGSSPVRKARQTLPRLQLNRSSFEGVREGLAAAAPDGHHHHAAAGSKPYAAGNGAQVGQQYQNQHGAGGLQQQQQYGQQQYGHQQYGHQQHYSSGGGAAAAAGRSRLGGFPAPSDVAAGIHLQHMQQQHTFMDPEHLIVNGMGGAFMHPTHVFSYSSFAVLDDEAATATAAIYSSSGPHRNIHSSSVWNNESLSWHCPMSPSDSELLDASPLAHQPPPPAAAVAAAAAAAAAAANGHGPAAAASGAGATADSNGSNAWQAAGPAEAGSGSSGSGGGASGVYKCAALFPSAATSLKLGRNNLHLFRFKNSRFDVIGGAIYFLSIVSILPRCNAGLALLSSTSLWDFMVVFTQEFMACWYSIFMESYLSLFMACAFFLLCLGFAKGGGVGAVSGERAEQQQAQRARNQRQQQRAQRQGSDVNGTGAAAAAAGAAVKGSTSSSKQKRRSPVVGPLVKLRTGGGSNQLLVAMLHTGAHLSLAIVLLLLLELGVETCIKYESLGNDGMGSMYRWFEAYQDEHFPDPMGLRAMAHKWSLGLYPGVIKAAMAVYDIPEAIAVVRNAVCAAPSAAAGFASLSRLQVWAYYGGMLAYYWLLATPAMGFVFGLYLYISVCWFHVHYDEAFSALRIANFKGLSRLHITADGDLEIFTLGMDRVPTAWQEDPRWYGPAGAGSGRVPAHMAVYPSRWMPAAAAEASGGGGLRSGSFGGDFEAAGLWDASKQQQVGRGPVGHEEAAAAAAMAAAGSPDMGLRLVDYVKVPRIRPQL